MTTLGGSLRTAGGGPSAVSAQYTFHAGSAITKTNLASGDQELQSNCRKHLDLSWLAGAPAWGRILIAGNGNGATGATGKLLASADEGTSFPLNLGPTCPINDISGKSITGAWAVLTAACLADLMFSPFLDGGNGAADPGISSWTLEVTNENPT